MSSSGSILSQVRRTSHDKQSQERKRKNDSGRNGRTQARKNRRNDKFGEKEKPKEQEKEKEATRLEDRRKFREQGRRRNRSGVHKPANTVRCTLFNGFAWSTEKKYMRSYNGTFDIFFGIEVRMRREDMEEQFNKESKEGWRLAADAARFTNEKASSEDRKHTSGGVIVAIDSHLEAVIDTEEGAVTSILGNEGRIAPAWVNVRAGMRVFAEHVWRSEGWTQRNEALMEAVVKQATTTPAPPWLVACDANMGPENFKKSSRYEDRGMLIEAPGKETSTCRTKGANGELVGRTYDHVIPAKAARENQEYGSG